MMTMAALLEEGLIVIPLSAISNLHDLIEPQDYIPIIPGPFNTPAVVIPIVSVVVVGGAILAVILVNKKKKNLINNASVED